MKILHLEDHLLFAEGLSAVLSQQNPAFDFLTTSNASQAIQFFQQHHDIDLILIDLNLPGLDGFAFIESLLERNVFTPFIVLSASENLWDIKKALELGAAGFIPKTAGSHEIIEIIEQVMQGQVYLPDNIQQALNRLPDKEPDHDLHKTMAAYQLGQRQLDVLRLMQKGYNTDEIAQVLNLSRNTIKTHSKTLFAAFQVKSRIECVRYAEQLGLL